MTSGGKPTALAGATQLRRLLDRAADRIEILPEDELALLVVHGVLHVLGMDHAEPDDRRAIDVLMLELEEVRFFCAVSEGTFVLIPNMVFLLRKWSDRLCPMYSRMRCLIASHL